MEHPRSYADRRLRWSCALCGTGRGTADHVPSKVFLDAPYPPDLPWVHACSRCNGGVSLDEEYVACLLECVVSGSVFPGDLRREKIARILRMKPLLGTRLASARSERDGAIWFSIERERVEKVILKLARGHSYFELSEPHPEAPSSMAFAPLVSLTGDVRSRFSEPATQLHLTIAESAAAFAQWPEVGSRAMQRLAEGWPEWTIIQPGNYRYSATVREGVRVRIVVREYLACEVCWE